MKKKEKNAVIKTCLDILPVRSWEPSVGAFLLADSSYLDLLRLVPRDLQNIAEDELELEIYQFTKVLKTVGCDLKFLSMRFPLSLERQKAVLLHHARQAGDETRIRWLERQIRELEVAETNISSQHFYLAYWGKDADTLRKNHDMIRKYAATGYQPLVEEIDARQKAKVLEKLANMNTIIDIYPDGDDDSAPGFMEEEGCARNRPKLRPWTHGSFSRSSHTAGSPLQIRPIPVWETATAAACISTACPTHWTGTG